MKDREAGMEQGQGHVRQLFIAQAAGGRMESVPSVRAVPGRGLEGDRYFYGKGSFSRWPGPHREVTLISEEMLEEMARASGLALPPEESRRNVLTRGVDLASLVKREFRAGPVLLRGERLCQPCKYLARLTDHPDLVAAMLNRGGIRARILSEGVIAPGDLISAEPALR